MGQQQLIDLMHAFPDELVARVGRRIYEQHRSRLSTPHHNAAVTATRPRLGPSLLAGRTGAEERGHAASGASAHEREGVRAHNSPFGGRFCD